MARWKSATELSELYLVGEQRLFAVSRRGNLPMLQVTPSETLYDEDFVARLFPRRDQTPAGASGANWGVLGEARLGVTPLATNSSLRAERARAARQSDAVPTGDSAKLDKIAS